MALTLKDKIIDKVRIIDLAADYNLKPEKISSGNFDYRCKCPAKKHKNGVEKTASLYIDSVKNNFYCYGCQSSFNSIDFYMICEDVSFSQALSVLKERVDSKSTNSYVNQDTLDNLPIMLEISNIIRATILKHPDDLIWINKIMKKTDEYLVDIKKDDIDGAKKLFNSVNNQFKKRYEE